jgi:EAL and modified HD-GYP domain-containing signal transduction protein
MHRALPADRVVLEVLEDEPVDTELSELLREARADGYRIALDDYTPDSHQRPLLPLADIVKIDLPSTPRARLQGLVADLRAEGAAVLAEKVETVDDLDVVRRVGVDLVQGFYFQRPEVVSGRKVRIGQLPAVRLLAAAADPDVALDELETIIACDPALAHRLLRLAGSAAGAGRPVATLRSALVLLGRRAINNLAMVAMVHGVEGKTSELATTGMVRAKMCEHLAEGAAPSAGAEAFLAGLVSVLDAVFDAPLAGLLDQLRVPDELAAAVVDHDGALGAVLETAIAYERADLTTLGAAGPDVSTAVDAYGKAVLWADDTMRNLTSVAGRSAPVQGAVGAARITAPA